MALYKRDFHSFSTIQEHAPQGWGWCMSKAYCKWPVIIAIIIAIVFAIFTLYCCLKCCGCCGSRRLGRRRANTQQPAFQGLNPLAYQGYQPAGAPAPGYGGGPPQYAQFDAPSHNRNESMGYGPTRKIGEDSLPAMPTWSQGTDKKIMREDGDVEMGHIDTQKNGLINNASTADLSHGPPQGYSEVPSINNPPKDEPYTGPDFGAVDTSYGGAGAAAHPEPYTGPDFGHGAGKPAYTPYAPSNAASSTRYEPTGVNEPQGLGSTYSSTLPPPSPSAQQAGFGVQHAPSVLQAGRRPDQASALGFKDV